MYIYIYMRTYIHMYIWCIWMCVCVCMYIQIVCWCVYIRIYTWRNRMYMMWRKRECSQKTLGGTLRVHTLMTQIQITTQFALFIYENMICIVEKIWYWASVMYSYMIYTEHTHFAALGTQSTASSSLVQNIVSFIGLFCKRDLSLCRCVVCAVSCVREHTIHYTYTIHWPVYTLHPAP